MPLSSRAHQADLACRDLPIWEVLLNLWDPQTNPDGILSLGVAENLLMHDELSKHVHDNFSLATTAFTYGDGPSGSKRVKHAVSHLLNRHLKPAKDIDASHITITNGCSAAVEHTSWAFADPGDGFLLGQPFYGTFVPDVSVRPGSKVVSVPFGHVDPLGDEAVAKYEETLLKAQAEGTRIAGLILCHPHNPLGRCYSRSIIIRLMELCQKYNINLISDEIYALSVWTNDIDTNPPPVPFESILSIDPTGIIDPSLVHCVWGMSKDFGANGIRMGAIISQANKSLHSALISVAIYSSPSSLSEHITANLLEDDAWVDSYILENQARLAKQYKVVVNWAKQNGIAYAPGVNAAFFLWVDLGTPYKAKHPDSAMGDMDDVVTAALLKQKVFLASGKDFGSEKPGWFRIVFSQPDDYLNEGLTRVAAALKT